MLIPMFVRQVKRQTTGNISVQIVRSYRNAKGEPRQKIVRHMGSAPPGEPLEALLRAAEVEKKRLAESMQPSLFPSEDRAQKLVYLRKAEQEDKPFPIADARKLEEEARYKLGYHEVFGELYAQLGFDRVWGARNRMAGRLFRQAVLMRLAAPGRSKSAHAKLSRDHGVEVSVDKLYRMMDKVDSSRIQRLQGIVSEEVMGLLGGEVEVVFFDVTTLSFASDREDGFLRKGWSKDGRPHRVQVVMGLFQSAEGLPLGYELFPGNTADVSTLEPAIEGLRRRMNLGRVVFVGDAGMMSKGNIEVLEGRGYDWVVAARLRSMSREDQDRVFGHGEWEDKGDGKFLGDMEVGGRRLVLRHCGKRARKDSVDREKVLEKLGKRLEGGIKGNGRRGRFLKIESGAVSIDEEAVERDKKFDGLHGVWTSLERESAEEVYRHYGELWRIEEGFRVMKHTMAVRPVFHWTRRRVEAHMAICFVAFALLRMLRFRHNCYHGGKEPLSEGEILSELGRVEASLVCDRGSGKRYLIPSSSSSAQRSLYAALGLKLRRQTLLVDSY